MRTSENFPSETVWKRAEGFSTERFRRQEVANRGSFVPSWRPSESRFGVRFAFSNSFSETVWKIARVVLKRAFWWHQAPDRCSFAPSWHPSEAQCGTHPDFSNSFSTHSGE